MKLQDIPTGYKSFADNQLLTAAQLNLLIQYLDSQDRMSRLSLTGAGIICGLELSFRNGRLMITQGTGLTTDGDLIKIRSKIYTPNQSPIAISSISFGACRPFNNHRVRYTPFIKSNAEIPLLELLTDEDAKSFPEAQALNTIAIHDFVVVLYLEHFTKPYDVCNDTSCDSQGIPEVFNFRYFLIHAKDVENTLVPKDFLFQLYHSKRINLEKTEPIHVPRVTASSLLGIQNNFRLTAYRSAIAATLPALIESSLKVFNYLVDLGIVVPEMMRRNNFLRETSTAYSQYDYDYLLDLVSTYNELRKAALAWDAVCNPDPAAFPKHLLLGGLQDQIFRHRFYKSSALSAEPTLRHRIQSLVNRFHALTQAYQGDTGLPVEIRPSKISRILGEKAIPRYYRLNKNLLTNWSFGDSETTLSSENSENRLTADLTGKDFFRIEGIGNKNWASGVLQVLQAKKVQYGLNFDIVCLSNSGIPDKFDFDEYPTFFQDLQTMLVTWRDQQACLFSLATSFLTGFSKEQNGGHSRFSDLLDIRDLTIGVAEVGRVDVEGFKLSDETMRILESMVQPEPKKEPVSTKVEGFNLLSFIGTTAISAEPVKAVYHKDLSKEAIKFSKNANDIGSVFQPVGVVGNLSVNDMAANFDKEIKNAIPDLSQWNTTDRQLRITYPTRLLAAIAALLNRVPNHLNEISPDRLTAFENALNELCQLTQTVANFISGLLNDPEKKYQRQGFEDEYVAVLSRLKENCCAGDFLKAIFSETLLRKARILQELSFINFARKHPGLEHFAGVPNGGTFVVVFDLKTNRVVADFALPYLCCSKGLSIAMMVTPPIIEEELPIATEFTIAEEFCKESRATVAIPFTVKPEGTAVQLASSIAGASINGTELILTPSFVGFGNAIRFVVAGESSEKVIVIREIPLINLKYEFDKETSLHLIHASVSGSTEKFEWTLNGQVVDSHTFEKLELKSVGNGRNLVQLTVSTPCGEFSHELEFEPESIVGGEGDCTKLALNSLNELKAQLARLLSSRFAPREVRNDLQALLNAVEVYEKDPESFVSGKTFPELFKTRGSIEVLLKHLSGSTNQSEANLIASMLVASMQMLYAMLGCADQKVLLEFEKDLIDLFRLLETVLKEPLILNNLQQTVSQLQSIVEFRTKQGFDPSSDPLLIHLLIVLRILRTRR
ncbi:hypothetical protein [Mongoliitalea daihaiensis]|uniref:hypothetical protein n=1 Tax=Mongoliitalea daihaiensis TaxID=2782006 RepID=UPI001F27F2DD|nr:hypothetical protein [Mongoliitalea daihaiensis]UJP63805.1 hypothetical protein IPZ59_13320 [Mongoliitalea daihaiensis]